MPNERILLVDDEPGWVTLVKFWLETAGYTNMDSAGTGTEALAKAQACPPDCILLDLELPDQSGMEVCRKLRSLPALSRIPVVLLTGHKREKVLGLQSGADYFVGKSERPHELLATLDAVFRRRQMEEGTLTLGELVLKSASRQVFFKDRIAATLTPKMFVLFHVLVRRSPQPVSRVDLYRLVGGVEDPGLSRALDVMLNRLRKSLPDELERRIVNVKNFGYVFLPDQSAPA
ncbi:MAG: response regulator transcription factor [Elusimicrobia bacterium]|nr:response regulator transcription factor [Elusimicrobiota bacterium]